MKKKSQLHYRAKKYKEYCTVRKSETSEPCQFYMSIQQGDTFEVIITNLRLLSVTCSFGGIIESVIQDKIVMEIRKPLLKK